jgi:MtN3 and saliva related transmembrane protein
MITFSDLLGYVAAALTTSSFVPQAYKTFRSKDVSGISLTMYSMFTFGMMLWLAYGFLINAWPIIVANAVTLTLALTILTMRLRYHK